MPIDTCQPRRDTGVSGSTTFQEVGTMNGTEPRSKVSYDPPRTQGSGVIRRWQRVIGGTRYSFTAVTMPDGERRYFASRLTGYAGGPKFACAWKPCAAWTITPDFGPDAPIADSGAAQERPDGARPEGGGIVTHNAWAHSTPRTVPEARTRPYAAEVPRTGGTVISITFRSFQPLPWRVERWGGIATYMEAGFESEESARTAANAWWTATVMVRNAVEEASIPVT